MDLFQAVSAEQRKTLLELETPAQIQAYLDDIPYVGEDLNRSPLRVIQDRKCHCLDGGMLAAALLSRLGFPPRLIDLIPIPGIDDDHVLAVFQNRGLWGAVAKSNFTGLRYRDPVYRSLRELVMSYFESFFNADGIKTLRAYTRPLNLQHFGFDEWQTNQVTTDAVVAKLYSLAPIPVLPDASVPLIARLDARSYSVGFIGVNMDGLYKPH